jgi:putative hydrolase of the HAD superfamily
MGVSPQDRLSSVKAIYFDLDDTLLGYWNASKAGLRRAFELFPVDGKSTDEMITAWGAVFKKFSSGLKGNDRLYQSYLTSGEETRTIQMDETLKWVGVQDDLHAKQLSQAYMDQRDSHLRLFDDSIEVLEILKPRFPLGLITNGPADIQNQEIDTVGIRSYFSNIFIEGEMRIGKPYKEVFDRAADAVGCKPEQLLMIGNSFGHDIKPAMEYGWATVWTRRDSDVPPSSDSGLPEPIPTSGPMPTLIVESLSEILPYLP